MPAPVAVSALVKVSVPVPDMSRATEPMVPARLITRFVLWLVSGRFGDDADPHLVPFVGSFFPLVIMVVPGNTGANRYGPPPPPNSTAVKVLCSLWIVFFALIFAGGLLGGFSAVQEEYESNLESSYDSGSVTTDEVEVVEPPVISADEAPPAWA